MPSVVGLATLNKVIHYFYIRDIVFNLKLLRLCSIIRLVTQIKTTTDIFTKEYRRKYPRFNYLLPLIGVLCLFVYVLHWVAFLLAWISLSRIDSGDSWFYVTDDSHLTIRDSVKKGDIEEAFKLYASSFYFATTTMTSVGYGDYKPIS